MFGNSAEVQTIPLEVCLSCLGWEESVLHYSHAADGRPVSLDGGAVTPEFPGETFRETTALLVPTPSRWRWQDWGMSNGRENLNRLGGHPTWVQSAEYPDCAGCGQPMYFLLQLDSHLPTSDGGEWLWGSGGICYAFSCRSCRHTAFLWQCT